MNESLLVSKGKGKGEEDALVKIAYGATEKKKLDFFDEILSVEYMKGYRRSTIGTIIYWTAGLLTGGLVLLVFNWFLKYKIRLRNKRCELGVADKVWIKSIDNKYELCKVVELQTVSPPQKMLVYRHTRFFFNTYTQTFERLRFRAERPLGEVFTLLEQGVPHDERLRSASLYGPNVIDFPVPSIPKLLLQEVLHPFFIFQIYSVILWSFEDYYYYAGAILFIALVSIGLTLKETRSNLLNLKSIARHECPVQLLRDGKFQQVSSMELIPGDIIEITQKLVMPCDVVLLRGQAVINESMLTGESIPVIKVAVGLEGGPDDTVVVGADPRTVAFGGTIVLKLQPAAVNTKVLGMVLKCGFETTKGALILSILFPKPSHFKFFRESLKFLGILCIIGVFGFGVTVYHLLSIGDDVSEVFIRALDLITIVVPPALPMAMTVGTGFALIRLKKNNIYCISPPRINMAGKIEVFCFDKTGTLTEEGLDLLGLHPASDGRFDDFTTDLATLCTPFLQTMATCHTLTTVDEELIGDPLELKIFQATMSTIHDGLTEGYSATVKLPRPSSEEYNLVGNEYEIGLLDRFEFQSQLQRMSVIVRDLNSKVQENIVFVKGSPEMIQSLSLASTVPKDYAVRLAHYTNKGYRVLACGYRKYDGPLKGVKKELLRQQVEIDLVFLGFIVMENKVKRETPKTLTILQDAKIRCIMVTGDNVLTAVSVARECGLIDSSLHVFMGDRITDPETGEDTIQFNDVTGIEGKTLNLDSHSLTIEVNGRNFGNYALAITGKVWETLFLEYASGKKRRFLKVLEKGAVFARMTPDQKAALVEELQQLGLYVAMCGDGANDCGALKAAHVGISLSEAEASIAAPFTSTRPNITCTPVLIKEGRASLGVSFKLFQFMGLYSMIQFMSVILLYYENSVLGNWEYLYQDLWTVFPLVIFMGKTTPCEKLAKKRPSGRLVSGAVVGSLLSHVLLCALFQVLMFVLLQRQPWYYKGTHDSSDDQNIFIYEQTCLFIFGNFQFLIMAFIYSWGKPFLNAIYTNHLLFGTYCLLVCTSMLLLFLPTPAVWNFAQMLIVPLKWRTEMFVMVLANLVLCSVVETVIYAIKHRRSLHTKQKDTFKV